MKIYQEWTLCKCFSVFEDDVFKRTKFQFKIKEALWVLLFSFVRNQVNSSLFTVKINWNFRYKANNELTECHGASQQFRIVHKFMAWTFLFGISSTNTPMTWETALFLKLKISRMRLAISTGISMILCWKARKVYRSCMRFFKKLYCKKSYSSFLQKLEIQNIFTFSLALSSIHTCNHLSCDLFSQSTKSEPADQKYQKYLVLRW